MFSFVLAAVLVLAVSAQTPPTLSDDFVAEVKLNQVNGHRERHIEGKWFFDKTGKRDRFDAELVGLGRVDAWKIWNSTAGGMEYFYENGHHVCRRHAFTEKLHGVFDFLPHATLSGSCDGSAHLWSAKVTDAFEMDACVSVDGKTPLWVERKNLVDTKHHVVVRFHTYKPGRPDASNFVVPAACNH